MILPEIKLDAAFREKLKQSSSGPFLEGPCYEAAPSYVDKTPEQLYTAQENEKKKAYNHRIMHVDKGSFTPLIFSTTGGMGPEATKFHKRLAELIADKRQEKYSDVVNHIRTRLRFSLLKSILVALHGERGKRNKGNEAPISDLSLNLIPERSSYEI